MDSARRERIYVLSPPNPGSFGRQPIANAPVSRKYCGALDDVPERIATRSEQLGGYIATVNFISPLVFPELSDTGWEALKGARYWNRIDPAQLRTLQLLNFIAYAFSDLDKAAVEKLAADGRLADYIDEFRSIVTKNGGHIIVKCAFQLLSKSREIGIRLNHISRELHREMPKYRREMALIMGR